MTKSRYILIRNPIEKFWKFVFIPENPESCWLWTGRKNIKGYGVMKVHSRTVGVHRFSYELHTTNEVPDGMCVCHKCDNPSCVNPNHLYVGTIQDNNLDRDRKGRKALGERNGKSKLTDEAVKEIIGMIRSGKSISNISRELGIPYSTVDSIKLGRSWTWLSESI